MIANSIKPGKAKNVILVIGDVWATGDHRGANYLEGAGAFPGIDALPLTGQMTHYSVNQTTGKPDYAPDSWATGTAWASGVKTYDNAVGIDRMGKAYPTFLELAKQSGLATGNVSTSEIHAPPPPYRSATSASAPATGRWRPRLVARRQPRRTVGEVRSASTLDTRPDVTLGGGSATFAETATAGKAGKTLAEQGEGTWLQLLDREE